MLYYLAMNTKKRQKFRVVTLGCRTNQYESQAFRDQLLQMGYEPAEGKEDADLCIVNTCTVTESADSRSRYEIRQLAKKNPHAKIIVTGCSVERQPEKIEAIEGVAQLVKNADKEILLEKVFPGEDLPEFSIRNFDAHTRAFVKVQDGCNSFCTYCIIPYVRGRSRSRTMGQVLEEVKDLIANGYKEIVLTGINIGDFDGGADEPRRLAELVKEVDAVPGLERLRVSSIDPDEVDDEMLETIINGKKTCRSMHIVLQSGSNVVLKRMNRKYTRQMFMDTVSRLRSACPDFTFTTDVIVGFPGETERDHQETLEVLQEVQFAKVHMFPYSPRPRTRAALYSDRVPADVIQRRKQEVLRLSEEIAFDLRSAYVGRRMSVLTENYDDLHAEMISGHTDNFLPVMVPKAALRPNTMIEVECRENTAAALIGKVVGIGS
ncbi:putative methylthiotransferase CPn_0477/CP_0277/CPj0477/CpB0496 [Waddlia chondrophila 2032/99]|uniref:Putative methylthiotransferase CPn_0477/CP_0277/CPj0477/CpB0496 n=1 Tax=Waddlia chondrophila 2032/99 TaxID=765953 RepID=F8LDZ6_9BACT|nr:putative methylthiotransferase CPn_0477/CP_0277/CPj0477/CpB0496 [Waddlia chondrophila 2032/99]